MAVCIAVIAKEVILVVLSCKRIITRSGLYGGNIVCRFMMTFLEMYDFWLSEAWIYLNKPDVTQLAFDRLVAFSVFWFYAQGWNAELFTGVIICFCTLLCFYPELPAVYPQCSHSKWAEVSLHSTHVFRCGRGEDLSCGQSTWRPKGAVPGSALPHRGLQSVSFYLHLG